MTEPITTQKSFIIPNTSDLPGAWGTSALNPNFQTIDALFGGVTTITLSSATTILLTVPATSGVWPGGLSQSVNALIRFTGAQSASATIQFTLPGFYIIDNQCTGGFSTRLQPANLTGNCVGAINGKKHQVFYDGVHMDYVDMADPGTAYDLHTNTTTLPPWMTACTVQPYLLKNGATYSSSIYPALSQLLGSTYGGNGITTFGVPDEMARFRLAVDASGAARVTSLSGINGSTFGAAGGNQLMQSHSHANTLTDPTHTHAGSGAFGGQLGGNFIAVIQGNSFNTLAAGSIVNASTGITITNATTGSGSSQNMPPAVVSFLPLIKT